MKVTEIKAENSTVSITLEPEHPAEIALVNLMNGCDAACLMVDPPKQNPAVDVPPAESPKLQITVAVKKGRGY